MRFLCDVGDGLLVVLAAPGRHQRVQRVPVRNPIGLAGKARIVAPSRRSHRGEPGRPLPVLARRDRRVAIARRQDADGGAVTVGHAFARSAFAAVPGARQLGHRQRGERFVDRNVDQRAGRDRQRRMHAGAGGGDPTDEGGLLTDRTDRRLHQIIHLTGQQMGDAAGVEQRQVGRGLIRERSGLAERRDQDEGGGRVDRPDVVRAVVPVAQPRRATFADDQVGVRQGRMRDLVSKDRLAVVQIRRERCRGVRVGAGDVGPKVGEQPPTHGGGQPVAKLNDAETGQ